MRLNLMHEFNVSGILSSLINLHHLAVSLLYFMHSAWNLIQSNINRAQGMLRDII